MSNIPNSLSNDQIVSLLRSLLNSQAPPDQTKARALAATPGDSARGFSPDELAALRPYVVSMRQGRWDTGGIFNSTSGDVDALFGEHAEAAIAATGRLKIVLYAHGGLVSEKNGLAQAQTHINWWKQSAGDGIYPIYFIWKTGLGETIAQLLGLAGGAARALAAAPREWVSDPVVVGIARRLGGEAVWSGMKRDAEQAVLPNGAATYVAQKLKEFCDRHPGQVELHAAGHSAGSIFHSHFIPLSTVTGNPYFTTTSFMAPAVNVDTFFELLTMQRGGERVIKPEVGHLTLFTMKKDFEKHDDCIGIYHQSLLYLISHALETADPAPILGLEETLRGDSRLAKLMGLGGTAAANAEVVWSKTSATEGCSATEAIHHGDFSSDAPTLNSLLRRILGRCDGQAIHPFPEARSLADSRGGDDIWNIWAPPDDLPGFSAATGGPTAQLEAEPVSGPSVVPPSPPNAPGNRKALCVGIDAYAAPNTLTGCVHDAHTWADLLTANRFATRLLIDAEARYEAVLAALRELVQSSRAGDVLVFQYSGHGTTVPDLTQRTVDGVEEAMVPVDFSADHPKLLMDFELGTIFNALPAGVNLTCFIDCCHSGTILRVFAGRAPSGGAGAAEKARFITLSEEEIAAVGRHRNASGAVARGLVTGGQERMREVAFAACRADEVAWEVNGQGEFTRVATGVLAGDVAAMTNEQFQTAVTHAFGAAPRQHPNLDCAQAGRKRGLLQPL